MRTELYVNFQRCPFFMFSNLPLIYFCRFYYNHNTQVLCHSSLNCGILQHLKIQTPLTLKHRSNYFRTAWTGCGFVVRFFDFLISVFFLSETLPMSSECNQILIVQCTLWFYLKIEIYGQPDKIKLINTIFFAIWDLFFLQKWVGFFSVCALKVGTKAIFKSKRWLNRIEVKINCHMKIDSLLSLSPKCLSIWPPIRLTIFFVHNELL